MDPIKSAFEYPDVEFDYSNCVLVRALEENPEYSSHDFKQIAELKWYTHVADLTNLPDDSGDPVCVYNHDALDTAIRFRDPVGADRILVNVGEQAAQSGTSEVPADTGIISSYTKLGREEKLDDEVFYECLDNIAENLVAMDGVTTAEDFGEKIKNLANEMRSKPEWQFRPDEIFARVVEKFAAIHNPNKVEHYRHPSARPDVPDWIEEERRRREEAGEYLVQSEAEKEKKLHENIDFRSEPAEEFTTEEIVDS